MSRRIDVILEVLDAVRANVVPGDGSGRVCQLRREAVNAVAKRHGVSSKIIANRLAELRPDIQGMEELDCALVAAIRWRGWALRDALLVHAEDAADEARIRAAFARK